MNVPSKNKKSYSSQFVILNWFKFRGVHFDDRWRHDKLSHWVVLHHSFFNPGLTDNRIFFVLAHFKGLIRGYHLALRLTFVAVHEDDDGEQCECAGDGEGGHAYNDVINRHETRICSSRELPGVCCWFVCRVSSLSRVPPTALPLKQEAHDHGTAGDQRAATQPRRTRRLDHHYCSSLVYVLPQRWSLISELILGLCYSKLVDATTELFLYKKIGYCVDWILPLNGAIDRRVE